MKRIILLMVICCFAGTVMAQKPVTRQKLIQKLTSQPQFPGGDSAMAVFLYKNIHYPQMEKDNDIQGRIIIRFMVDTTGALTDIELQRHVSPGIDKEALRVVKLMPDWEPGLYKNKPVPVIYFLPVAFMLN